MKLPQFVLRLQLWQLDASGAAMVCLAAGVWYFAGIEPLGRVRAEREAMAMDLASKTALSHEKAHRAETQKERLTRTQEQIKASSIQLQAVSAMNQHLSNLTEAAGKAGLRVDEIKPSPPKALTRFNMVSIRLAGAGEFSGVESFFQTLRNGFKDTGVTGFELERVEREKVSGTERELRFAFDLVWYAAPQAASSKKK